MDHTQAALTAVTTIDVRAPLRRVCQELPSLLRGFSEEDWRSPTVHAARDVKDLTAHLLDGTLRRLAVQRDRTWHEAPAIGGYADLVAYIQRLNSEWMQAARRLSPRILIELIEHYDREYVELLESLAPAEQAIFSVAWAGEEVSANWFDVAREYTEKWHHQQQLRDATGREPLYAPELLLPVLDTFARGLPFAYRDNACAAGTRVSIAVTGAVEHAWTLVREDARWTLWSGQSEARTAIAVDADSMWRIWTKGMSHDKAWERLHVIGDRALAEPLVRFVAIMA